jgi:hypothetical protein
MNPELPEPKKTAWVQLYEARRPAPPPRTRPRGRPPRVAPRKATVVHLTAGERSEIDLWQKKLSPLLGRKVSLGETAGILARICSARLNRIENQDEIVSFADLVRNLVETGFIT